jgi:DMSO/TMAO reductase YedYZ molybdopterin-dependent catalytic subunit
LRHHTRAPRLAYAFSAQPGEEVLTWLDQPAPNPVPDVVGTQLKWEALESWLTPNDQFFTVGHYDKPVLDAAAWRLQIGGLVQQPMTLTLDDLKARPRQEVTFTLECSGKNGLPFLTGAVGNATW